MKFKLTLSPLLILLENNILEFKNVIEFGALLEGRKKVIRLVLSNDKINIARDVLHKFYPQLFTKLSTFYLQDVFHTNSFDRFQSRVHDVVDSQAEKVLFIGNADAVEVAWGIEESNCSDISTANCYGYPECCGLSYQLYSSIQNTSWIDLYLRKSPGLSTIDFITNRFSSLVNPWIGYHYDYFPCQPDCKKSQVINNFNRLMLLNSDLYEFVKLIDCHLQSTVITQGGYVWYVNNNLYGSNHEYKSDTGLLPVISSSNQSRLLHHAVICNDQYMVNIDGNIFYSDDKSGLKVINYQKL